MANENASSAAKVSNVGKNILIVLSEFGYWGEELVGPVEELDEAGYRLVFATPTGQRPEVIPPSADPNYIDPALGRSVTTPDMARRVKELAASQRLNSPLALNAKLPDRPYVSHPAIFARLGAVLPGPRRCLGGIA